MRSSCPDPLLRLVESFFREHLQRVRGASPHTVLSYRDSLRLFLCFLADSQNRNVSSLTLDDIVADQVLAFLDHVETKRGNSVATRNQRLAALRAFAEHLLRNDPTRADQYGRVLGTPTKKMPLPVVTYLEPEEVQVLLRQPDRRTSAGRSHFALLLFLYNTGARVSEALALRPMDVQLDRPSQVRLRGKGNKDRFCPIWRETADTLSQMIELSSASEHCIFLNARGRPITRDGVAYLLIKYSTLAANENPSLAKKRVTPHVLRHSCAVALLQAGIDISVIRDYLGHTSIATTSRYISTNLKMKREVLEAFWERAGLARAGESAWESTPDVLAFLESL